jgi:hypothetical protein
LRSGVCPDESITPEVQRRRHHAPQKVLLRATNQVYAGKDGVQPPGADPVSYGTAPDTRGPQLMEMQMPVLQLGKPRNLDVPDASDLFKRKNRPRKPRFF